MPYPEHPLLIGIIGPSCAGKTEITSAIQKDLPLRGKRCGKISLDNYYIGKARMTPGMTFDEPGALDLDLLGNHMEALRRGESIKVPQYDMTTSSRTEGFTLVNPNFFDCIVFEGLFLFHNEDVRDLFDLKLLVTASEDTCKNRRIARDTSDERKRTVESVLKQWPSVIEGYAQHIKKTEQYADFILENEGTQEELLYQTQRLVKAIDAAATMKVARPKQSFAKAFLLALETGPGLAKQEVLLQAIANMRAYGVQLESEGASKGKIAIELADSLQAKVLESLTEEGTLKPDCDPKALYTLLHSQDKAMSEYRLKWSTLVLNIAIALTGVGLLVILGHYIKTSIEGGRGLCLFQQPSTTCETHINTVDAILDAGFSEVPVC